MKASQGMSVGPTVGLSWTVLVSKWARALATGPGRVSVSGSTRRDHDHDDGVFC